MMKNDPSAVALLLLVAAVALYVGVVSPLTGSINKARGRLAQEETTLAATRLTVTQSPDVESRSAQLEATNAFNRSQLLTPLLSSYSMRAKSLLAEMAFESGLTNVEYEEGGYRDLPAPKGVQPVRRTGRHTVVVKTQADYAAIASFVLRAEKELPRMTVQSLTISPAKGATSAERQSAELVLEWPCEGEVVK